MKFLLISAATLLFIANSFACVQIDSFKYCKGYLVINKSGLKAQIISLLPNDKALIQYPQHEINATANLEDLALSAGTSLGYHLYDEIVTPFGEAGIISGFFQDGSVAIYTDDYWTHKVYSPAAVATREGCTESDFCVGDIVRNKYNMVGKVVAIYPLEEKVFLSFKYKERFYKWSTTDLTHN